MALLSSLMNLLTHGLLGLAVWVRQSLAKNRAQRSKQTLKTGTSSLSAGAQPASPLLVHLLPVLGVLLSEEQPSKNKPQLMYLRLPWLRLFYTCNPSTTNCLTKIWNSSVPDFSPSHPSSYMYGYNDNNEGTMLSVSKSQEKPVSIDHLSLSKPQHLLSASVLSESKL